MARKDEDDENTLTEEQRIAILEKTAFVNRIILLVISLILIIGLSVTVTSVIINAMTEEEEPVSSQRVADLEQVMVTLNDRLDYQQKAIDRLNRQAEEGGGGGTSPLMQRHLVQQEKDYQEYLKAMKTGMHDLSRMIPGSRVWLEAFDEDMDKQLTNSQVRLRMLESRQGAE